jgi:hypothetical protein
MLHLTWLLPAVWFAYTAKAWWVARHNWSQFSSDTKAFYLIVTPPLALALDLLMITDKMFYSPVGDVKVMGSQSWSAGGGCSATPRMPIAEQAQ